MGREAARHRHRHALGRAVDRDLDDQLRRHVAVQALPGQGARRCELGGERLLRLGHLQLGAFGRLPERERVLGGIGAARDERLDIEGCEPRAEALHERADRGAARLQLDHVGGRLVVTAVGRDEGIQVRAHDAHL